MGLKPLLRKVWSKIGERPRAIVQHRYEWLYVSGFVQPKMGKTFWYLIPRVNTQGLNLVYENLAKDVGISAQKKCDEYRTMLDGIEVINFKYQQE